MRIVSFNVNSLRARLHQLQTLINSLSPDIIGLQETKVSDEEFPVDALKEMGYQAVFHGQKSHYGVALLSRQTSLNPVSGFSRRCVCVCDLPCEAEVTNLRVRLARSCAMAKS